MPRGGHKVIKPAKAPQAETLVPTRATTTSSTPTKLGRANTDWKASLLPQTFLSRPSSETKLPELVTEQPLPVRESSRPPIIKLDVSADSNPVLNDLSSSQNQDDTITMQSGELECSTQRPSSRASSVRSIREEESYEAVLDTFQELTTDANLSTASSSVYSRDSASIYSCASSIYSSGASIYSFEDAQSAELDPYLRKGSTELGSTRETDVPLECRFPGASQYPHRPRPVAVKRPDIQDAAARERSTLARKAAMFQNSRLRPQLPSFNTSLPTWSMACRAIQASKHCYDSQALIRRGSYTAADSSKDIKAMIVDDQLIDSSRVVIVAIRGTESQSLSDWTVNTSYIPTKPVGFLDDAENACHSGFLQVAKSMIAQVASQLQQLPTSSEKPSLLFTGHSAGGAVAAVMYCHMVSTTVQSNLTALADQFSDINCMTFGAPPVSVTPRLRSEHVPGVFYAFANEGDLVLRTSNGTYFKSLAKLMTASPPPSATSAVTAAPAKVVRVSRGAAIIRQVAPVAPPTPWEDLPLWPTPAPSLANAGEIILLRDNETGYATASQITAEDLREVIFGDFVEHTSGMYIRRVKEMALGAMMGTNL